MALLKLFPSMVNIYHLLELNRIFPNYRYTFLLILDFILNHMYHFFIFKHDNYKILKFYMKILWAIIWVDYIMYCILNFSDDNNQIYDKIIYAIEKLIEMKKKYLKIYKSATIVTLVLI